MGVRLCVRCRGEVQLHVWQSVLWVVPAQVTSLPNTGGAPSPPHSHYESSSPAFPAVSVHGPFNCTCAPPPSATPAPTQQHTHTQRCHTHLMTRALP